MKPHKRHKSSLSILVVPDDKDEPRSFRLSMTKVRVLTIVGIALLIHILMGGVAYWRYIVIRGHNIELIQENRNLHDSNAQIDNLFEQLNTLEQRQNKVITMLGIGEETAMSSSADMATVADLLATNRDFTPAAGGPDNRISNDDLQKTLSYLAREGGDLHKYSRNIPTFPPVEGILTKEFTTDDRTSPHLGIDIAADIGTPIHAAADGIVIFAGWVHDLGNLIIIAHGNGFFSWYGHNKLLTVSSRELVEKGQIIALLGNSGQSSGPHLHFEIWKDIQPVNPRNYIIGLKG